MRARLSIVAAAATLVLGAALPSTAATDARNVEHVTSIDFTDATHLEFMDRAVDLDEDGTAEDRTFALAGSRDGVTGGMRIIDITDPEAPEIVAHLPCRVGPGDVAAVQAGDKWYAVYGSSSRCTIGEGTDRVRGDAVFVFDITDLRNPIPLGWPGGAGNAFGEGAHTIVAHPTEPVVWVASQNLADRTPSIWAVDLRTMKGQETIIAVAEAPGRSVAHVNAAAPHDITFNPTGTRAYLASVDATFIVDSTNAMSPKPVPIATIVDPELVIHHEAVLHPNGRHLLIVNEMIAAPPAGTPVCPGGGVVVWDLGDDSSREFAPVKVGSFYAADTTPAVLEETHAETGIDPSCTAHEFQISPDGRWMPIGWMAAGVRVFDLQPLIDAAAIPAPTPVVVGEAGHWRIPEVDIWAAKWHPDHPNYIFATDTAATPGANTPPDRMPGGFKVFRFAPPA